MKVTERSKTVDVNISIIHNPVFTYLAITRLSDFRSEKFFQIWIRFFMLIFKRLLEYGFSKYWNRRFLTFPWPSWPCRQKCSRVTTPHPPRIHCRDVKQQLYAKKKFCSAQNKVRAFASGLYVNFCVDGLKYWWSLSRCIISSPILIRYSIKN